MGSMESVSPQIKQYSTDFDRESCSRRDPCLILFIIIFFFFWGGWGGSLLVNNLCVIFCRSREGLPHEIFKS